MIIRKSSREIEKIAAAGALVAETIAHVGALLAPGVTTEELDAVAGAFIRERGGVPTSEGYKGYPKAICISPNDVVVHGIPDGFVVSEGDLVTIDVGVTLDGYVGVQEKPRATVALTTTEEDPMPILVHWRYGLGRSVAFASDSKARWSSRWVGTDSYTQFWTQVVRWTVGSDADGNVDVSAEIRDGELIVTADAFAPDGSFRNFLEGEARIVAPDLTVRPIEMRQVAPGRYQGVTRVDQDGSWLVDGLVPIPDVKPAIGIPDIPEDRGFHTLAGFVMWQLGRVPKVADAFVWHGWRFEVVDMDGRRIDKVAIIPPRPTDAPSNG